MSMSTEADIVPERLWCTACGAVTRDRICDCNDYPEGHEMRREPHFVNYADQVNSDFMECRKELLEAQAEITKLRAERDAALNGLKEISEKGVMTGYGRSALAHIANRALKEATHQVSALLATSGKDAT